MFFEKIAFSIKKIIEGVFFCIILLVAFFSKRLNSNYIWGTAPLINIKYWSASLRAMGLPSVTLVTHHYPNNRHEDFDIYYSNLIEQFPFKKFTGYIPNIGNYLGLLFVIKNAKVVHIPFAGGQLGQTPFWKYEGGIYKYFNIRTVVIPYGGDAHQYSQILNTSMRNALLIDYPAAGRCENKIAERVTYWNENADCVICGLLIYGMSRWDVTTPSPLCIDMALIRHKDTYTKNDGIAGPVRIVHAPNHRGFKGTEFIIEAVQQLINEGLKIDLLLLENMANSDVIEAISSADILVDQLIAGGYALNAIEGMACGTVVVSNMEDQPRSTVFRRYSFLEECPIPSATPETIKALLKTLITNPDLRIELGFASRAYAEKYHSYKASQFLFGAVYKKIIGREKIDLMNLYHPLLSRHDQKAPKIKHPLIGGMLNLGGDNA
jgi:glycosyltransferase involved in cell wall biosynthesis